MVSNARIDCSSARNGRQHDSSVFFLTLRMFAALALLFFGAESAFAQSAPPTITKSFSAATVPLNGAFSLTFTITNPNAGALSNVAFTDVFPAGIVFTSFGAISAACGPFVISDTGGLNVDFQTGSLAAGTTCTFSVNMSATTVGIKNNVTSAVTSTESGAGGTASASITVVAPPVIIKSFGAATIPLNGSTSLTFEIDNSNATVALSGVGFTDTLPAGLVVATPNGLTGSCGGGTIAATAGSAAIGLTGGDVPVSGNCTFSVNVTGIAVGTQTNTTGQVTSTEGGTGGTATASVSVIAPPVITKSFTPGEITAGAKSVMTFTLTNPAGNTIPQTGVAFTDLLPTGGLHVTNDALTISCTTYSVSWSPGNPTIPIVVGGVTLPVNGSCTISFKVTSLDTGTFVNTTSAVSSTEGGTGGTATATLLVDPPVAVPMLDRRLLVLLGLLTMLTAWVWGSRTRRQ